MTAKIENPLLSKIRLPGETHTLPSRGLFYTNGELSDNVKDGELHVLPMTTIDEITMRSSDLLYTGKAINDVFNRCIPDVLQPMKLLQKDVDFLLTVLRKVTYGNEVEITYTHTCKDATDQSYNIELPQVLRQIRRIDPTTLVSKFHVPLPNEQIVSVSPLRYEAVIEMLQLTDKDISVEERTKLALKFLLGIIDRVDNITDKDMIAAWLEKIPAGYARKIDDAVKATQDDWGIDFNVNVECRNCKQVVKISAPLNPLFFFI